MKSLSRVFHTPQVVDFAGMLAYNEKGEDVSILENIKENASSTF
jgi:hypothetical protein